MTQPNKEVELTLDCYKCGKDLYIACNKRDYNGRMKLDSSYPKYIINGGVDLIQTHHSAWYKVENQSEISSVTKLAPTKYSEVYFVLKDKADVEKFGIPEKLTKSEVNAIYDDDDYFWTFDSDSQYKKFEPFYDTKRDTLPQEFIDVEFKVNYLGEIENKVIDSFSDIKVKQLIKNGWKERAIDQDLSKIVTYSELSEMLVPDLVIHNQPCSLSSDTTYAIVRNHIKENIDSSVAHITSDYDFCFTVKKRIKIKPYERKIETTKTNGKSYKPPRFKTSTVTFKEKEIFEMTPASRKYGGYTVIDGFKGDNLSDLVDNIKRYLDEIMNVINEPLVECECCGGYGHIIESVKNINKR